MAPLPRPLLGRLWRARRGVAALEFALVTPILIVLLAGAYDASLALRASWKAANAAQSIADLVAQQVNGVTDKTGGSLQNFCTAARLVMAPYPTSGATGQNGALSVAIVSITNNSGTVAIDWESDDPCATTATSFGTAASHLAKAAIPNGVLPPCAPLTATADLLPCTGDSIVAVQVTYVYRPALLLATPAYSGLFTFNHIAYARPRSGATITCTGGGGAVGTCTAPPPPSS
jgi:Flp pilus assembly protein TadG